MFYITDLLIARSLFLQISDFGIAKLVGKTNEVETTASKVVNAYGYLAPEYVYFTQSLLLYGKRKKIIFYLFIIFCRYFSNGLATTKSDVYAFGVVLFEVTSGKEAIIRTQGLEKRSLASTVSSLMRHYSTKTITGIY